MRVTYRATRKNLSDKHNDRNFDINKSDHINSELTKFNVYWHPFKKQNPQMTFEESEKKAYEELFSDYLEKQNQKHIERRQYKRCRTIDDILKNKNTKPEETIFQIGNKDDYVNPNKFAEVWKELNKKLNEWNKKTGNHCRNLNFAVHLDETTPHIHLRRVWVAYDKELNCFVPKQELALEQAKVPLPNPNKPKSRTNNRKITFDKMVRGWFQEICINKGLDIETEPLPSRKHKDKETFIDEQIQAKQEEFERLTNDVEVAKRVKNELSKNKSKVDR